MSTKYENPFAMAFISKKYLKSDLADVHFTFPNDDHSEMVPAHKFLLASASPVFQAMFYGPLKEADIVKITDSNADAFKEFLQFVYLPEVTLTMENLEGVLHLIDKYDVLDCFETCAAFIEHNLTVENMLNGYQLAIKFNNSELKCYCERIIRAFTTDALKSDAFLQCTHEMVEYILQQDVLQCNETDLFEACIEWAKSACQRNGMDEMNPDNLKNQLGDCFHLIRFGAMDGREVTRILSNELYDKLFSREELMDIMQKKIDSTFQSKIFKSVSRSNALTDTMKLVCKRKNIEKSMTVCYNYKDRPYYQSAPTYTYYIEYRESTWFSTNEPILLKCIKFCGLKYENYQKQIQTYDSAANMEIIEYNSNTRAPDAPFKVLYKSQTTYNRLSQYGESTPLIIINPKKIYEIRLICTRNHMESRAYHNCEWSFSDVKVNDKITVTFHPNPLDYEKVRRGVVSELEFYPL